MRGGNEQWPAALRECFSKSGQVMEEAANSLTSRGVASADLRPDVDSMDPLRAVYGLSINSADDWSSKARTFVDILLQGSRP